MPLHVLITGTSTRAAAESAARAGFRVTALDGYADLDQHPAVRALSMPRDFGRAATARAMARASRTIACDAVAYLSPFENHPRAVSTLAAGRALWGNPPEVLRRVRDPEQWSGGLRRHGFAVPRLRIRPRDPTRSSARTDGEDPNAPDAWLVKPLRSGGGQRIRRWQGEPLPRGCLLQEWIGGVAGSVVFVAAGGTAVPLGVSRQLIGEPAFGSSGFRYCGSIMAAAGDAQFAGGEPLAGRACALAAAAAAEFGLVGVNAIDFVARGGEPYPIEINPRWSSSMELVESLLGVSLFQLHADSFDRSRLPRFELSATRPTGARGKAIVFARQDVVAVETGRWLSDPTVRDVPHPGERIGRGQPVCSVFGAGECAQECYEALLRGAERVYADLETRRPP